MSSHYETIRRSSVAGYWIDPKGKVFDIPHFMHESFAKSRGALNIADLIRRGWIRALVHEGAFNFQFVSYTEETALEHIEDFLSTHASQFERWGVTLETENPLQPAIHLMDRDIRSMGLKDAVTHEIKLHRLRPFGMMDLDEDESEIQFYGEFSSCVRTRNGVRRQMERYWYDPDSDEFICERVLE